MHLVRRQSEALERVLAADSSDLWSDVDEAWDTESLRREQAPVPERSTGPGVTEEL
jgi:hypothetical protein